MTMLTPPQLCYLSGQARDLLFTIAITVVHHPMITQYSITPQGELRFPSRNTA